MRDLGEEASDYDTEAGPGLFRPRHNCWRTSKIMHGTLLVDCADFYRALHSAIVSARKQIIIVGWDIDSRIRLLRGEDERKASAPSRAGELLAWKARENPEMEIYLLRWDASITFMGQRELLAEKVWEFITPPNVHVWLDSTVPAGGSHHQKVIIIDDEVAFTGGMDIAPQRWDERAHRAFEAERYDEDGRYEPYHDIQIVVTGPVVDDLAALARWRWAHAAGYDIPRLKGGNRRTGYTLPYNWPADFRPDIGNMDCALARTIPWMGSHPDIYEIEKMYLDLIGEAENFIYIENQFLAYESIAAALNKRLKENEKLKILVVSSYNPQGIFEREAMWAARIDFKKILYDGIVPGRVRMAYPEIVDEMGRPHYKRIHSKIFTVDDRYFVVASSNLNHRSMKLDTECDLALIARTPEKRATLAHMRNDLIMEHAGMAEEEVSRIIDEGTMDDFITPTKPQVSHLREIDDSVFTHQKFKKFASFLADPDEPLLPEVYALNRDTVRPMPNPKKHILLLALVFFLAGMALVSYLNAHSTLGVKNIELLFSTARGTPWALPLVCLIYVIGGLLFFPVTVLSLVTAAVFGVFLGPVYAMTGALLSASLLFWIGELMGLKWLRKLFGEKARKIDNELHAQGVLGMAAVRLVPIAPFSLVNLVGGISSIRFRDFIAGSFLGLLPGLIAKGLVGDSLARLFLNPSPDTMAYLTLGIIFWIIMVIGAQKLVKKWEPRKVEEA